MRGGGTGSSTPASAPTSQPCSWPSPTTPSRVRQTANIILLVTSLGNVAVFLQNVETFQPLFSYLWIIVIIEGVIQPPAVSVFKG